MDIQSYNEGLHHGLTEAARIVYENPTHCITNSQCEILTLYDKLKMPTCKCINIKMGSYDNQTDKILPWAEAKSYRNPIVGIDNCILEEIEYLWNKGIKTVESCCGHNTAPGFIAVTDDSIWLMIELRYQWLHRPYQEDFDPSYFIPQSIDFWGYKDL